MLLGCVADDFTGAGDAAAFLQAGGAKVILCNGIPKENWQENFVQAVVIALKTRTIHPAEAVNQSLAAFRWLKSHGARMLYFKYCSTFDSTEKGNIGPVLDAVMEEWDIPYTLLCPTLLENGRMVKDGVLYVHGVPLADSPMKDHPLTPMRDSQIKNLMERQSRYPCYVCRGKTVGHYYLIPDYYEESHGRQIAREFGNHPLLSGGSGLLKRLAESWGKGKEDRDFPSTSSANPVILAGSCSEATRGQIEYFEDQGGLSYRICPLKLAAGIQNMDQVKAFLSQNQDKPVLLYTSADPKEIEEIKKQWNPSYGRLDDFTEQILAEAAVFGLESGRKKIIAAGGETSGAVMQKLGFSTFDIGPSISPGVPVMHPVGHPDVELILKSGNFGGEDFFVKAV